jgi:hypothetical protein
VNPERKPSPGLDPKQIQADRDAARLIRLTQVQKSLENYLNVVYLHERKLIEDLINDLTPEIDRLKVARPTKPE